MQLIHKIFPNDYGFLWSKFQFSSRHRNMLRLKTRLPLAQSALRNCNALDAAPLTFISAAGYLATLALAGAGEGAGPRPFQSALENGIQGSTCDIHLPEALFATSAK